MEILEYQAKGLLRKFGVPVPPGAVAYLPEEAAAAARTLGGEAWVVKGQALSSSGRAASMRTARSPEDAAAAAADLLGSASATGVFTRVYVERALEAQRPLSLAIAVDTARARIVCEARGADRSVAVAVDPAMGLMPYQERRLAYGLDLRGDAVGAFGRLLAALYAALHGLDALAIEIDPLVLAADGTMRAAGVRIAFDETALFRHPEIQELREDEEADPILAEAVRQGLAYVRLAGSIGCLANGAGLALACMDLVARHGGAPANFVDVGAGATREQVSAAMKLMLAEAGVEGILVACFGGLVRCDLIAEGLVAAIREAGVQVPLVVRLDGTNAELGRKILKDSGLHIVAADSLDSAAAEVVKAVREYV